MPQGYHSTVICTIHGLTDLCSLHHLSLTSAPYLMLMAWPPLLMASLPPLMSSAPPPIHHLLCHNSLCTLIIILHACIIVSALHLYPTQPPPLFRPMFPRSATLLVIILRHHSFISASSFISADQVLSHIISFWSSFSVLHWWCTSLVIPSSFPRHSFVITLYLYSMLHLFPRSAPLLLRSAIPLWPLLCHSATQVLDWDYTFCSIKRLCTSCSISSMNII